MEDRELSSSPRGIFSLPSLYAYNWDLSFKCSAGNAYNWDLSFKCSAGNTDN